jgi:hypothetical protein
METLDTFLDQVRKIEGRVWYRGLSSREHELILSLLRQPQGHPQIDARGKRTSLPVLRRRLVNSYPTDQERSGGLRERWEHCQCREQRKRRDHRERLVIPLRGGDCFHFQAVFNMSDALTIDFDRAVLPCSSAPYGSGFKTLRLDKGEQHF